MSKWGISDSSVALALQSNLLTPNTTDADFVAIQCTKLVPKLTTDVQEFELLTGQVGASPEKIPGRNHGTVTIEIPLEGFKDGYDPTAENPGGAPFAGAEVIPPWLAIVANILGSHIEGINTGDPLSDQNTAFWRGTHLSCNEYTAAGVTAAGTDSTHITCDNAGASDKIKPGEAVLAAMSVNGQAMWGFVKTKVAQLLTLFDPAQKVNADNAANLYGTATAWLSSEEQRPLTLRWTGEHANSCYELTGLKFPKFTLTLDAGAVSVLTLEGEFQDFRIRQNDGGLVVPDAYDRAAAIIGAHLGSACLDSTDTLGLEGLKVTFDSTAKERKGHSAAQGIADVLYSKKRVHVEVIVPYDSADDVKDATGNAATEGDHKWQSRFRLGTSSSLGVYVSPQPGRALAVLAPAAKLAQAPELQDSNDELAYALRFDASTYTGDSSDIGGDATNSPLDSLFRISCG